MTLLDFMNLFPEFRAASWDAWRSVLVRLAGGVREFWAVAGRGSGKSQIAALLACWFGSREYRRAPGEAIYCGVFAPDRKQAGITFRYVRGLLRSVPALERLIIRETRDSIELSNGVVVEVITATTAAPRGRAYALAIVEEGAFLPTDESANPDVELLRALRPALARVPGSLLVVVGSPYARRGITWEAERRYGGGQVVDDVVYERRPTLALNPTFDAAAVAKAYEEDPASAAAEYGAEFRADVESFASREAVEAAVEAGCSERGPLRGQDCSAFIDPAGGSGKDSMTLAIAHEEGDLVVLDLVREVRPPFSPEETCKDFAAILKAWGVYEACGDAYAGSWPAEVFSKHGDITYEPSAEPKSRIYERFLPALNSGRVRLLDHARLKAQLLGLERRTTRAGRDSIDHAPGGHDDVINAAAGAVVLASSAGERGIRQIPILLG